jgi:hypothetical protein
MAKLVSPAGVEELLAQVVKAHESGHPEIVVLESWKPWKQLVFLCESAFKERYGDTDFVSIKYIVFDGKGGWRTQAVPCSNESANNNQLNPYQQSLEVRKPFPASWCGLIDGPLTVICGVEGARFVQNAGFIAGNKTREGAIEMARVSLSSKEPLKRDSPGVRASRIEKLQLAIDNITSQSHESGTSSEVGGGQRGAGGVGGSSILTVAQYHQAIGHELIALGDLGGATTHLEKSYGVIVEDLSTVTCFSKDMSEYLDMVDTGVVVYAESLEHICEHEKAIAVMEKILNMAAEISDAAHLCFPICTLLLLKLYYVSPCTFGGTRPGGKQYYGDACRLVEIIDGFPMDLKPVLKLRFKSHWAFFIFIKALINDEALYCKGKGSEALPKTVDKQTLESSEDHLGVFYEHPSAQNTEDNATNIPYPPLYVVGDSHTLTYGWRSMMVNGRYRTIVPFLITGIKAWHVQSGTKFYTHTALLIAFKQLKSYGCKEIIFSAGEIDVREGIGAAFDKGKYSTLEAACSHTAQVFIDALEDISKQYSISILLLPVPPHASRGKKNGRWKNRQRRRKACVLFNRALRTNSSASDHVNMLDFFQKLCSPPPKRWDGGKRVTKEPEAEQEDLEFANVLNPMFDSDKTHLNKRTLALLESSIQEVVKIKN